MQHASVDDTDARRLYELIWKRTMASQMSDAEFEKTIARIDISTNRAELTAQGEVMKFDGFLKAYTEDRDDDEVGDEESTDSMLPPLAAGQALTFRDMKATERFSKAAPRYTEASLVKRWRSSASAGLLPMRQRSLPFLREVTWKNAIRKA